MEVTILIPTYNEKVNLEKLVPLLYSKIYLMRPNISFSTLIVDDNSQDGTRAVLDSFVRTYPHFFVSYGDKSGIGAAMKRGYAYAMENMHAEGIVTYESDFVFPPETILSMIDLLSENDVVIASRVNEAEFYSSSLSRRVGHFVANTILAEWIAGMTAVHEHTSAGRAIKVNGLIDEINFGALPNGYAFFPAMLYELSKHTASFRELPVRFQDRQVGTSKMVASKAIKELLDSFQFAIRHRLDSMKRI